MANTFAMTVLLITLGLAGESTTAAEVGIVQGATLAMFYAFSANARSLILSKSSVHSAYSMMVGRLLLLIPLSAVSYWLSAGIAGVEKYLALILILRRCIEWLNEVHLSEMEREGVQNIAKNYFLVQALLLVIAVGWFIGHLPFPLVGLFIWAFLPFLYSAKFIWKAIAKSSRTLSNVSLRILPHLGSTAIIGITVYVFRLLLLLLLGKETAGDLYTAFAIGGLTGSVFANALGPSIALQEQRSGKRYFPAMLRWTLNLSLVIGAAIFMAAMLEHPLLNWTGKSYFFWETTGLSMIGGVIMVYAQRVRFRLLQHDEEHDVFGPDVLMNILIITSVPFVFYLYGREAMSGLYLLSSLLAFVFYISAKKEKGKSLDQVDSQSPVNGKLRMLIGVMLLLPLFFQISTGVFRNPAMNFESGGVLSNLPIPISVLACYGGILLLGAYRRAFVLFGFIFLTCVLMVMSAIILTQGQPAQQQAKFILLIQFILPMIALVLGQVYEPLKKHIQDYSYAKAFLWVLLIVVPVQLIFTWGQGLAYLSPYLGLFSIYQHLQYVPVIFVSAYLISLFGLWHIVKYKIALLVLVPFMAAYAVASLSMLAMALLFAGMLVFALFHLRVNSEKLPLVAFMLALVLSWGYFQYDKDVIGFKFGFLSKQIDPEKQNQIAPNVAQRLHYWKHYASSVTSSPESFFLGHEERPDRTKYPSAHNYYLDFIYNFGALALLPMLFLIGYTVIQIYRYKQDIFESPALLGLCLVVLFLLIIDNSFKVGLRQPYPGIFTFFLWGVLLGRLFILTNKRSVNEF